MNYEKKKYVYLAVCLIAGSLMLEGISLIALQIICKNIMSNAVNVATIAISIIIASIIFPSIMMKKRCNASMSELGLVYQPVITTLLIVGTLSTLIVILCYHFQMLTILIILQNIFVASGEEFVARGCLFFLLRKILKNEIAVILVSTLIFVFIFHSNSGLSDNLIWRLPITIVLALLYSKTRSIVNTGLVHLTYNVIVSV